MKGHRRRSWWFPSIAIAIAMEGGGCFKRLVLFKFKEGIEVEDMLNRLKKLLSEIDLVKSAEWGAAADIQRGSEAAKLRITAKGFTHALVMRFENQEGCLAFMSHPAHVESGAAFIEALDDFLGLNFPVLSLK